MDQRGREANKRYRDKSDNHSYKTISLTFDEAVYSKLAKAVSEEEDKNMSKYIEENIDVDEIKKIDNKREYKKQTTIKKTFTFTDLFAKKLKESGNMSLAVETALKGKFNIQ